MVTRNFGDRNGTPIVNKKTILADLDRVFNHGKPPALEYLFVEHISSDSKLGTKILPVGHACVRYTLPDGTQYVMNIVGLENQAMVNFVDPSEYLFGTSLFGTASEQCGIYNRSFCGLRIERLPEGATVAIHKFYECAQAMQKAGIANFQLLTTAAAGFGRYVPFVELYKETGNCAIWTSRGLACGGLMYQAHMFPKAILVDLLEKYSTPEDMAKPLAERNVHMVYYKEIEHCVKQNPEWKFRHSVVNPLRLIRTWKYWDLEKLSDCVVEVPKGSMSAVIRWQPTNKRKGVTWFGRFSHTLAVIGISIFLVFGLSTPSHWAERVLLMIMFVLIQYLVY